MHETPQIREMSAHEQYEAIISKAIVESKLDKVQIAKLVEIFLDPSTRQADKILLKVSLESARTINPSLTSAVDEVLDEIKPSTRVRKKVISILRGVVLQRAPSRYSALIKR